MENAFITYNGFYTHGQTFPVAFDVGVQDVLGTLEEAMSFNDAMVMERSSAQVVATEFGGHFRSARLCNAQRCERSEARRHTRAAFQIPR